MSARTVRCPECHARFEPTSEDYRYGEARCPECRAIIPIRSSSRSSRGSSGGGSSTKWVIIILLLIGLLGLGCCGGCGLLFWQSIKPTNFPEQTQDYADARKGFKTTLTTKGASPQPYTPVKPPAGVKEVTYTSGDLKLKAWVDAPPARQQPLKPAVLFLHSGFAFDTSDWDQCQPFRDNGFVTMTPMLRGENGLPGSFTMFYHEVDDVVAAAEALALIPGVDPNHIYVAGHSAGGTLAMLAAMTSTRFKGCASFSGSPDQPVFVRMNADFEPPFDTSNFKELEMRSPLAYPMSFKCPARLYWGNQETLAFGPATRRLAEKATAAGKDVKAIEVQGNHNTMVNPAMSQAVTFFKQLQQRK